MNEAPDTKPNQEQEDYWQEDAGHKWAEHADQMDLRIGHLGHAAMDLLKLAPGQSVLDVGCGCGATSLEIAQRVGAGGSVQGVDLSEVMLNVARVRAQERGLAHAAFHRADVQTHPFSQPFDAVFSRFGVMFFADPFAAFQNLAGALKPGGKLAFVCWRAPKLNPWLAVPRAAIEELVEMPEPPEPGAPGPFAFADRERVLDMLQGAGFRDVGCEAQESAMMLGDDVDSAIHFYFQLGPFSELLADCSTQAQDRCKAALRQALAPFQSDAGVALPTSTWLVSASI